MIDRKDNGFTLVELLAVIAILGIVSAIVNILKNPRMIGIDNRKKC